MTPIFLLSLPRSGSTVLQRVLATHVDIDTAQEPWILLPLLAGRQKHNIAAKYDHSVAIDAIDAFTTALPNGVQDMDEAIRQFATTLYKSHGTSRYFLDKTPRYAQIAPEIADVFPDAKYIFLWRNPLAIMASMIETWGQGRWVLFRYYADIFDGLEALLEARIQLADRAIDIHYEDLVLRANDTVTSLMFYLDLKPFDGLVDGFEATNIDGKMGDPTQGKKYVGLSTQSISSWRGSVCNPLRRYWFKRYLQRLERGKFPEFVSDVELLTRDLFKAPISTKYLFSDVMMMGYGYFYRMLNLPLIKRNFLHKKPVAVRK